jgi:hypothetical protein
MVLGLAAGLTYLVGNGATLDFQYVCQPRGG